MVRFSDLITKKDEKQPGRKSPQAMSKGENLLLSTPQIARMRKVTGGKVSPVPFDKEEWISEVVTCYQKFVERAINTQDRVRYNRGISASPILSDLHYILNKDLVEKLYEYATLALRDHEEMLVHNVEVTFLALMIGRGLGYDIKMLLKLGLAAFLENVGMYKIPERILQKRGRLDDEEISVIREHPTTSYEILAKMGERYRWLAEVAHQVHERSDGSGYPHGLSGAEIYDLSSILGLIDVYSAMISDRPYRKKFAQTDAIKFIVEESKGLFPAKIREVFLNQISLFLAATHVKLNNKSIGWTSPSGTGVGFKSIAPKGQELDSYDLETDQEKPISIKKEVKRMAKVKKKRVRWQPSSSPDVTNYRLYWSKYGEVDYNSDHTELGNVTEVILPDGVPSFPLDTGDMELGITAFNQAGNESDIAKLTVHFNFTVPDAPQNLEVEDV